MFNFFEEYFYLHIEFILFISGLICLLYSIYDKKFNINYFSIENIKMYILNAMLVFFIIGWQLYIKLPLLDINKTSIDILHLNNLFIFSTFNCYIKIFILVFTIIYLFIVYDYFKNDKFYFAEYIVGIYFLIGSMFLFISSYDFFIAYLIIELQAFIYYYLFTLLSKRVIVLEAVSKYFILNVFASLILILGISLIYGSCGSTKFIEIGILYVEQSASNMFTVGIFFFLIGIFFKLAIVPFHYRIGDIYEGLPLIVIIYYSVISKIPYLIFIISLLDIIKFSIVFYNLIFFVALLSILYSSLIVLYEINIMRILAYSAISHLGYILLSFSFNTLNGIVLGINYLFVYSISIFGTLLILYIIKIYNINNGYSNFWNIVDIIKFSKFSKMNYFITVMLVSFLLSFIGIPPFAGFFIKMNIFIEVIKSCHYFIFIILGFISVINAVFYLRLIRFLLFNKENDIKLSSWNLSLNIVFWVIVFCFIFNLSFFFFQSIILYKILLIL